MGKARNIRSMTAYGAGSAESDSVALEVEMRGVNSRFFDPVLKLPKAYASFESEMRQLISDKIKRGRVEVQITRTEKKSEVSSVVFNANLFTSFQKIYMDLARKADILDKEMEKQILLNLLSRKDILEAGGEDDVVAGEKDLLLAATKKALDSFFSMGVVEGKNLYEDVARRLQTISEIKEKVFRLSNSSSTKLKEKLLARIEKLAPEVQMDTERLAQEVAFMADRVDVTEELVRLESHIAQFRECLDTPPNGRKLDFILQEFGRELNTIGAKVQEAPIQALIVDAKAEMEKIKEQIQNLE